MTHGPRDSGQVSFDQMSPCLVKKVQSAIAVKCSEGKEGRKEVQHPASSISLCSVAGAKSPSKRHHLWDSVMHSKF